MFLFKLFLIFSYFFQFIELSNEEKCGEYSIDKLETTIRYKSHKSVEELPKEVKTSGIEDFSGSFGTVSVGFVVDAKGQHKCVAVKFLNKEKDCDASLFTKALEVAARIVKRLPKEIKREHLIELIDAGPMAEENNNGCGLIIMELGTETFADRLYERKLKNDEDEDWLQMIWKLAKPLAEFHEVAIHMDIKASNFLYVRKKVEKVLKKGEKVLKKSEEMPKKIKEVLKLIDYDGAQFINSSNKNDAIFTKDEVFTVEYCAPEYEMDSENMISRKFDIWSLGIIIYEAFIDKLRQEHNNEALDLDNRKWFLEDINKLYDYNKFRKRNILKIADKSSNIASIAQFDEITWERNNNVIDIVLQFWQRFPKTALLLTNMLHPTRQQRLTAKGILDYVNGNCYLREFKWARKVRNLRIFNYIKFGQLKQMIVRKQRIIRIQILKKNRKEMKEKYGKMKRKLEKIMEDQQQKMEDINVTSGIKNCENE